MLLLGSSLMDEQDHASTQVIKGRLSGLGLAVEIGLIEGCLECCYIKSAHEYMHFNSNTRIKLIQVNVKVIKATKNMVVAVDNWCIFVWRVFHMKHNLG